MSILDTAKVFFDSRFNYMKRDISTGTTNVAPPTTLTYAGLGLYTTTYTITHNLGFVPFFVVYYEPFGDGVIYVSKGTRIGARYYNPRNLATYGPICIAWATTTTLVIELGSDLNTFPNPFPVYWVIYKDYGIA